MTLDPVQRRVMLDDWHRSQGRVLCAGVCDQWLDEHDELGTCGSTECERAAAADG